MTENLSENEHKTFPTVTAKNKNKKQKTFYLNLKTPELGLSKSQDLDTVCGSLFFTEWTKQEIHQIFASKNICEHRLYFPSTMNLNCWTIPPSLPKP